MVLPAMWIEVQGRFHPLFLLQSCKGPDLLPLPKASPKRLWRQPTGPTSSQDGPHFSRHPDLQGLRLPLFEKKRVPCPIDFGQLASGPVQTMQLNNPAVFGRPAKSMGQFSLSFQVARKPFQGCSAILQDTLFFGRLFSKAFRLLAIVRQKLKRVTGKDQSFKQDRKNLRFLQGSLRKGD